MTRKNISDRKDFIRKNRALKRKLASHSGFCRSLLVNACGCRDDSGGYFEADGSACYDASCGCINFR